MSFVEEIKRPFNLLMIAIALIPGFYFYYFPRNDKQITFSTSDASLVYDSKIKSPQVRLVDSNGNQISEDTYLMKFTFWNNGAIPIEPSEIRRPITVTLPGASRILDYKIINALDQDTANFALTLVTNASNPPAVALSWNHFDPKKAIAFQLIYTQPVSAAPRISADIVGIEKLVQGVYHRKFGRALAVCATIFSVIMTTVFSMNVLTHFRQKSPVRWILFALSTFMILTFIVATWTYIRDALIPLAPF
jgi:hypothetical protein